MSEEELRKIVGPRYDYDEDVCKGKLNARNLEQRNIT
jgi:hypothetical protein